jgi:hypothetical protein
LNLGDEMHSIWDLWRSGLQECKNNGFFGSQADGQWFSSRSIKSRLLCGATAFDRLFLPRMAHRGANEVIGANYTVTTPFFKPLLIF